MVSDLTKDQIERLLSLEAIGVVNINAIKTAIKQLTTHLSDKKLYVYSSIEQPILDFIIGVNKQTYSRLRPNEPIHHISRNACVVILSAYVNSRKYIPHNQYLAEYLSLRPDLDIWQIYNWR